MQSESHARLKNLLKGVSAYQQHPYRRILPEPDTVWQRGSARLLDYGAPRRGAKPLLFVPSLINRYYVLDLSTTRSMARYLKRQGIHVYMLDWGFPGKEEEGFSCADYVTQYLAAAVHEIGRRAKMPPMLAGYCMGGVFALAHAQLHPKTLSGLLLLATPWNFHSADSTYVRLEKEGQDKLAQVIATRQTLPANVIQLLFYLMNPWEFHEKFREIPAMTAKEKEDFVALEQWVNDGVPLTQGVARDCFMDWMQKNLLAEGGWKLGCKTLAPQNISMPTLIALPRSDRIVPPQCAKPLARLMPHAALLEPSSGHVGMVVGRRAEHELWQPLSTWIHEN